MSNIFNNSLFVLVISFATLWFSAWIGAGVLRKN